MARKYGLQYHLWVFRKIGPNKDGNIVIELSPVEIEDDFNPTVAKLIFDHLLDPHQKLHSFAPIHDAVVVGHTPRTSSADYHLPIHHHDSFFDGVHSQNAYLWRVEDRRTHQDPNIPPLVIVKVPPRRSSRLSVPSFTLPTNKRIAFSIPAKLSRSASRMTGTTSPSSAPMATPIS